MVLLPLMRTLAGLFGGGFGAIARVLRSAQVADIPHLAASNNHVSVVQQRVAVSGVHPGVCGVHLFTNDS